MSLDRPYLVCRARGFALLVFVACPCFANADTEDYERGLKVLAEARQQREFVRRNELLDEAEAAFRTFLKESPEHSSAYSARSQIGSILVERARMQLEQARNTNENTQAEARRLYEQAYELFENLKADLSAELSRLLVVGAPIRRGGFPRRDKLRADYLQAQLLMAAVLEESADTYDSHDAKRQEILARAGSEYQEIYNKHRSRLAGWYARFYQGRSFWKRGKHEEALQCLEQVLDQIDAPMFSAVKTKALILAFEIWLDDSQKQYQQAAARGDEWLKKLDEQKRESPDSLGIQFRLARAHWLLAETLDDDRKKVTHQVKAKALAEFVAGRVGTFQAEARKLLVDAGEVEPPEPSSFAEAKAAGRAALDEISVIRRELTRKGIPYTVFDAETNREMLNAKPIVKPDPLQTKLKQKQAEAIRHFQLALKLADDQTPKENVDVVRYFLCYLHYSDGAYEKAAELGDELARDPDATGARQSAKIALASYMKIYESLSPKSEKACGVVKKLEALADHILDAWPAEPEADETLESLIAILIREDRVDDSVAYFEKTSTDSPRRNRIALRVGAALWRNYLTGSKRLRKRERDGGPGPDPKTIAAKKRVAKTKEQAKAILSDAIRTARGSKDVTQDIVTATLSLVQLHAESADLERVVTLLEDPKIGPLTLVQGNHPASQNPTLRREIYKTAIRVYGALDQEEKAEPLRRLLAALEEDD